MLIYSFITDYQAFSLRYKDNTTRDKNETKVGKQSANLGKNNEPIQNRLSFLIDCKSVILHLLTILSFPMVRPAWDNWWILQMCMALAALFSIVVAGSMAYKMMVRADRHYEAVQASCGQCHSLLVVPTCRYRHNKQRQQLVCT